MSINMNYLKPEFHLSNI